MTDYSKLFDGIRYSLNEPMNKHTTFRIGGPADCMLFPASLDELSHALKTMYSNEITPVIVGNGSNLLVSDKGIRGVVLKLADNMSGMTVKDNTVICQSGVSLTKMCLFALDNSFSGAEGLYGIPGTVGGAVYMNAGAYGYETKDILKSVKYLDIEGNMYETEGNEGFSYRNSPYFNSGYIVTEVSFVFEAGNQNEIKEKMEDVKKRRIDKQPLNYPSAGSVFKRPEGYYAAALIEQSGLKGRRVGDAMVSDKHSGFIVNLGNATAGDILSLIKIVRETVFKEYGVSLETEIRYIGE